MQIIKHKNSQRTFSVLIITFSIIALEVFINIKELCVMFKGRVRVIKYVIAFIFIQFPSTVKHIFEKEKNTIYF